MCYVVFDDQRQPVCYYVYCSGAVPVVVRLVA